MAARNRLAEGLGLVAGVAAPGHGGVAVGLELERRVISKRIDRNTEAEVAELFSLHTPKMPVTTPDGVVLHAEDRTRPRRPTSPWSSSTATR